MCSLSNKKRVSARLECSKIGTKEEIIVILLYRVLIFQGFSLFFVCTVLSFSVPKQQSVEIKKKDLVFRLEVV